MQGNEWKRKGNESTMQGNTSQIKEYRSKIKGNVIIENEKKLMENSRNANSCFRRRHLA